MLWLIVSLLCVCAMTPLAYLTYRTHYRRRIKRKAASVMSKRSIDWKPQARERIIAELKETHYDLLIIGGGSTGCGCALDAATRGLKVGLIEAFDFASEASSKSTKLLHGGIRYLEKAIRCFSIAQLHLVFEALSERYNILRIAPYLTTVVPIMIPVYKRWAIPYYWFVGKLYDWLSGYKSLGRTTFNSKRMTAMNFAGLKKMGLKGSVMYYDGMFDDARTNVMLAVTASHYGATAANYMLFEKFIKDSTGRIEAASCIDQMTGKPIKISARGFISAVGSFCDEVRIKNNLTYKKKIVHSAGTHIVYPSEYGPERMGMVDAHTADGRVVFILPWKGKVLVGATDVARPLQRTAAPTEEEVEFLHSEMQSCMGIEVPRSRLLSAWTGFRPLIADSSSRTEGIVRSYEIVHEGGNLITVVGGKWSVYRLMAEKCIDAAVRLFRLSNCGECVTEYVHVLGSEGYARDLYYSIRRALNVDTIYAEHLLRHYGARSFLMKRYLRDFSEKLSEKYEFRAAEIIYCIENEYALTACDIISNRFRICGLEVKEAEKMAEKVIKYMKEYFGWTPERSLEEREKCMRMLDSFGLEIINKWRGSTDSIFCRLAT